MDWEHELKSALQRLKGKAMLSSLLKVAWNAHIYCIWRGRNVRVHDQKEETKGQIMNKIKEAVRIRLGKLKMVKKDYVNTLLYTAWNLPETIFE